MKLFIVALALLFVVPIFCNVEEKELLENENDLEEKGNNIYHSKFLINI